MWKVGNRHARRVGALHGVMACDREMRDSLRDVQVVREPHEPRRRALRRLRLGVEGEHGGSAARLDPPEGQVRDVGGQRPRGAGRPQREADVREGESWARVLVHEAVGHHADCTRAHVQHGEEYHAHARPKIIHQPPLDWGQHRLDHLALHDGADVHRRHQMLHHRIENAIERAEVAGQVHRRPSQLRDAWRQLNIRHAVVFVIHGHLHGENTPVHGNVEPEGEVHAVPACQPHALRGQGKRVEANLDDGHDARGAMVPMSSKMAGWAVRPGDMRQREARLQGRQPSDVHSLGQNCLHLACWGRHWRSHRRGQARRERDGVLGGGELPP
mmetsp:Transcript_64186/g.196338  ORF Transcript_64186/g.196338 Transcript_64186/m.196338 type:complete len:329 (-) Transcript_64186:208-1194(-)